MGPLKAALYIEVWKFLQSCPGGRTLLTSLNSPTAGPRTIRTTWGELQANGRMEGVKKKTGLQAVLSERPDLFNFTTNEKGHLLIELTTYARMCEPLEEALLSAPTPSMPAASAAAAAAAASMAAAAITEALTGVAEFPTSKASAPSPGLPQLENLPMLPPINGSRDGASAAMTSAAAFANSMASAFLGPAADEPRQPQRPIVDLSTFAAMEPVSQPPAKKGRTWEERTAATCGMSKYGYYMDIVWTPELAMQKHATDMKDAELLRALVRAMEMHAGKAVTLSQLGADYKVAQLKKDPQFKNLKMLDILKQHVAIFEVDADLATGGWVVKLQPGAQAAIPGAEQALEDQLRLDMALPERIDDPRSMKERMQALRIELLHALVRRGNRVPLQELGQEPRVQQRKQGLPQAKKLIEFVKLFPNNFQVTSDETQMIVEAASLDVTDQFMIDQALQRAQQTGYGAPKGRGKGPSYSTLSSRSPPPPTPSSSFYPGNLGYGPPSNSSSHLGGFSHPYGYPPPTGFS